MVNACQESVQLIQSQGRKWQKAIHFERDARQRMERMCEQVATQSAKLEKQMQRASRRSKVNDLERNESQSSDDEEFHDALTDSRTLSVFRVP